MRALLLSCLLLAGCGQKGPLYFAPQETQAPAASTAPETQADSGAEAPAETPTDTPEDTD